jgi:WD40 repeat protein
VSSGSVARSPASSRGAEGYWVRWSSDGSRIASGADDGTVSLWSAMALDPLGTVVVPEERDSLPVTASFTADDQITVASYDGRVYQWDTDFDRAVAFACQMAGRNLSETEWEAALPDLPYEETCPSS